MITLYKTLQGRSRRPPVETWALRLFFDQPQPFAGATVRVGWILGPGVIIGEPEKIHIAEQLTGAGNWQVEEERWKTSLFSTLLTAPETGEAAEWLSLLEQRLNPRAAAARVMQGAPSPAEVDTWLKATVASLAGERVW